jgi:hypothetical protein
VRQSCRVCPPAHISPVLWHVGVPVPPPSPDAVPLHPEMAPARASAAEDTSAQAVTFMPAHTASGPRIFPGGAGTGYSPSIGETAGKMLAAAFARLGSHRATCAPERSMMRSQPRTRMNW